MGTVLQTARRDFTVNGDTIILGSNTTAGTTLCLAVWHNGGTVSFTDSQSNSYVSTSPFVSLSGAVAVQFFKAPVSASAPCTITVGISGGNASHIEVFEVTGRHASPWVTPAAASNGSTDIIGNANGLSTSQATGSFTPPSADCFCIFALRTDATGFITPPAGFTEVHDGGGQYCAYAFLAATSVNPTATNGGVPSVGDAYVGLFAAAVAAGTTRRRIDGGRIQ